MSLSVSNQFQKKQVIESAKVNTNFNEIVDYVNTLEGTLTGNIYALIPQGTKMIFYQATAPAGWTLITSVNDKFLRIVSGGGGSTGGTVAASTSLAHSHTVAGHTHTGPSHTHSISSDGSHSHSLYLVGGEAVAYGANYANSGSTDSLGSHTHGGVTGSSGTNVTGSSTAGTDSQLGVFAYADVVVASKD
jgi:hypothetical protein